MINIQPQVFSQSPNSILDNTWMNNINYLAAMAHIGWAALIIIVVGMFTKLSYKWMGIATGAFIFLAAIKEFWYDAQFEIPMQTLADNTHDFIGYMAGLVLAWCVVLLKVRA